MKKLKRFYIITKRSLTDPSYYKEIVKAPLWFSIRYLVFLLFILTTFSSIRFAFGLGELIPKVPQFVENIKSESRNIYPQGLVLTLKNQELSTNVKEPYYIDLPDLKDTHFITIDTKANPEDSASSNTFFLLAKRSVVIKSQNSIKIYPYSKFTKDGILTKDIYNKFLDKILPYLNYLPTVIFVLIIFSILIWPFIGSAFWLAWLLFYLLLISLLFLLEAAILKRKIPYSKLYQMGIHAVTLTVLINFILGLFRFSLPFFVPTAILLLFMGYILSKLENLKA